MAAPLDLRRKHLWEAEVKNRDLQGAGIIRCGVLGPLLRAPVAMSTRSARVLLLQVVAGWVYVPGLGCVGGAPKGQTLSL